MLRVTGFPYINLKYCGEKMVSKMSLCSHLCRHVFHKLGVVHQSTPVIVDVMQEVSHLVICREHS